jgi:hypothetical protein
MPFSGKRELFRGQPFHYLAEIVRPGPSPPFVRIFQAEAELVNADIHVPESGGLDHLA